MLRQTWLDLHPSSQGWVHQLWDDDAMRRVLEAQAKLPGVNQSAKIDPPCEQKSVQPADESEREAPQLMLTPEGKPLRLTNRAAFEAASNWGEKSDILRYEILNQV